MKALQLRTARRRIFHGGTYAVAVGEYLTDRDENGKGGCEVKAQSPVQSRSESESTDRRKQLPKASNSDLDRELLD
jgi:hypothetical protein